MFLLAVAVQKLCECLRTCFCKSQLFLIAVDSYKQISGSKDLHKQADVIYKHFLHANAVSYKRKAIKKRLEQRYRTARVLFKPLI